MNRYTPEQRNGLIEKVRELRLQGKTIAQACQEAGVGMHVYSYWVSDKGQSRLKPKNAPISIKAPKVTRKPYKLRKKSIPEQNFTVEVKPEIAKNNFIFIMGNSSDVMSAIDRLGVRQ